MDFFGAFLDLEQHDDSSLYRKEEPPSTISARSAPGNKKVDFLVVHHPVTAAIEVKNVREWFYPDRDEIRELLLKVESFFGAWLMGGSGSRFRSLPIRCPSRLRGSFGPTSSI
jgi:hypothetical protein